MSPFCLRMLAAQEDGQCQGAPAITGVTASSVTAPACGSIGWTTQCDVTISGLLGTRFELKLYYATNDGGGSWIFWKRTTTLTGHRRTDFAGLFGAGGAGPNVTRYMRFRAEVVPVGWDRVCHGPVDSSQISHTAPACTI